MNSDIVYNNHYKTLELKPETLDKYQEMLEEGQLDNPRFIYRVEHYITFKKAKMFRFYQQMKMEEAANKIEGGNNK